MNNTDFGAGPHAGHNAHADGIFGSIKSMFGGHEPGYHDVKPHIRVNHDHSISHIPGHLQSNPNGILSDNLSFHHDAAHHSHAFESVMSHSDPLLHHSEYHLPGIKF